MDNKKKNAITICLIVVAVVMAWVIWLRLTHTRPVIPAEPPAQMVKTASIETAEEVTLQTVEAKAAPLCVKRPELKTLQETLSETLPPIEPIEPEPKYTEEELDMLAAVIYQEAGGNACSDDCRFMVGDVVLNRVADERFPDTIKEVLEAPGQYGLFSKTGVKWPARAQYDCEAKAVERAIETARLLLSDEQHSELYGEGYIWQAEFKQGKDIVECDGLYFGR